MANAMRLLGAAVLACGCLAGCVSDLDARGKQQIEACYDAYGRGDDDATITQASEFLRDYSPSVRDDEAHYLRGLALSRQGDPVDARADLARAAESDRRAVRARSLLALGDLSLGAGRLERAEAFYRRSISEGMSRKTPSQHAYLRLGYVLQRKGQWADADVQFSRAMHHFPASKHAQWAAARIHGRAWTVRAGAFARMKGATDTAAGLVKAKLPAVVNAEMRSGKVMHVVSVGRYAQYSQAEAALVKVRQVRKGAYVGVAK